MNRNKKFRAWDGKKMIYGTKDIIETPVVTFDGRVGWVGDVSCATDEESYNSFEENKYWEVMQYTGLKDKNGKEIYEGDIVKVDSEVCVIEWWEGSFLAIRKADKPFGGHSFRYLEVIGNIYENKDINKKL